MLRKHPTLKLVQVGHWELQRITTIILNHLTGIILIRSLSFSWYLLYKKKTAIRGDGKYPD